MLNLLHYTGPRLALFEVSAKIHTDKHSLINSYPPFHCLAGKNKSGWNNKFHCFDCAHRPAVSLHRTCIIKYPEKNKVPCASDIPAWGTSSSSSSWADKTDLPFCISDLTSSLFQSFAANLILPAHPVHVFSLLSAWTAPKNLLSKPTPHTLWL